MKKIIRIVLTIASLLILVFVVMFFNDIRKFAHGESEDSKREFQHHKTLFIKLSFNGRVVKKEACAKCEFEGYSTIIKVAEFGNLPLLIFREYPRAYRIDLDSSFQFSIPRNIYESLNQGDSISKDSNSFSIRINTKEYDLISRDSLKWISD
jgi:hypothetical protein